MGRIQPLQAGTCLQADGLRAALTGLAYSENSLKTYAQQINQFTRFCDCLSLPYACERSAAHWILHSSEVLHLKKATVQLKLAAFKWAYATVWDKGEVNAGRGSVLYLTQRAIGRRADDRDPKLAVGRAGLRIMRANMCQGRECDREVQCWAWWLLSYKALLRCSEAASIRWEDVKFRQDRDGGRSMWFRLTVSGREIFKNHSESVEFRVQGDR